MDWLRYIISSAWMGVIRSAADRARQQRAGMLHRTGTACTLLRCKVSLKYEGCRMTTDDVGYFQYTLPVTSAQWCQQRRLPKNNAICSGAGIDHCDIRVQFDVLPHCPKWSVRIDLFIICSSFVHHMFIILHGQRFFLWSFGFVSIHPFSFPASVARIFVLTLRVC